MRKWINSKPAAAVAVVMLLIGVCAAAFAMIGGPAPAPAVREQAFYVDMTTGEAFAGPLGPVQPPPSPTGHAAVFAHVFACGDCSSRPFVAYVSRLRDDVIDRIGPDAPAARAEPLARQAGFDHTNLRQFAKPSGEPDTWEWHDQASGEAASLQKSPSTRCTTAAPVPCVPQDTPPDAIVVDAN